MVVMLGCCAVCSEVSFGNNNGFLKRNAFDLCFISS